MKAEQDKLQRQKLDLRNNKVVLKKLYFVLMKQKQNNKARLEPKPDLSHSSVPGERSTLEQQVIK